MNTQESYSQYLNTDYWKEVTAQVKKRAGYRCQTCNSQHDLNAHHRTYEHRGREIDYLDDLVCLCYRCHQIFHGKEKPAQNAVPEPKKEVENVKVYVTHENHKRLRYDKEVWHWMKKMGINPQKKGWARRAIGFEVRLCPNLLFGWPQWVSVYVGRVL